MGRELEVEQSKIVEPASCTIPVLYKERAHEEVRMVVVIDQDQELSPDITFQSKN